jgi:hypothetical protein
MMTDRYQFVGIGADTVLFENMGPDGWMERLVKSVETDLSSHWVKIEVKTKNSRGRMNLWDWFKTRKPETRIAVFKPHEDIGPHEWNMWTGWGVEPIPDYDEKLTAIERHIAEVICNTDKEKFCYVMRWLAWTVQHPDLPSEAFLVWMSHLEGTGKSIIGEMLVKIFGKHGMLATKKTDLLGEHAVNEHICFMFLDEALYYGDSAAADIVKNLTTGRTRTVNPKFRSPRQITNTLSIVMATNHDYAMPAGSGARRPHQTDARERRCRAPSVTYARESEIAAPRSSHI